jgi:hypothetical protein
MQNNAKISGKITKIRIEIQIKKRFLFENDKRFE